MINSQTIEIVKIGKYYNKKEVLKNVSISIKSGEAVALLGPNGAGKTTCFDIVAGLIKADYGQIILDGNDITHLPIYLRARLGVSYLPQSSSIFRGLSVAENIMAVLQLQEGSRYKTKEKLVNLMNDFSISHLKNVPSTALSGGERRRLEIARALATDPEFILLDEPLAGIDPIAVGDIRQLIGKLKERNIGVLITDHNVKDTLEIVDRAYILNNGEIITSGTPREIVKNKIVKDVYLGSKFSLD